MKALSSLLVATVLSFSSISIFAAGDSTPPKEAKPLPAVIVETVKSGDFDNAIVELKGFIKTEKNNANAWNWLGYSERKNGNFKASLKAYKKALKIDKKHLGANEYLGELYLMTDKPRKAKKQLKRLAKYCGDCEEYQTLSTSIAAYAKNRGTDEKHDY